MQNVQPILGDCMEQHLCMHVLMERMHEACHGAVVRVIKQAHWLLKHYLNTSGVCDDNCRLALPMQLHFQLGVNLCVCANR